MKSIIEDVEAIGARLRDIERAATPSPDVEAAQNNPLAQLQALGVEDDAFYREHLGCWGGF
jgi:hypothetical protein